MCSSTISIQMICSNHGRCLCDECFCDVDFAGEFCNISTVSILWIYVLVDITITSHKHTQVKQAQYNTYSVANISSKSNIFCLNNSACTYMHIVMYVYHMQRSIPLDCGGRTCVECAKGLLPSSECAIFNCSVVLIEEVAMTDYTINGTIFVTFISMHHAYYIIVN